MSYNLPPSENTPNFQSEYPYEGSECQIPDREGVIDAYLAKDLSPAQVDAFDEHCFYCHYCFKELRNREEIISALQSKQTQSGFANHTPKIQKITPDIIFQPFEKWIPYAAAILIAFASIYSYFFISEIESIRTPYAQTLKVNLPDGSIAHLNYDSEIRFPKSFDATQRKVFASGEIYFDVVAAEIPFVIETNHIEIETTEGVFNLRERDAHAQIVIQKGSLETHRRASQQMANSYRSLYELTKLKLNSQQQVTFIENDEPLVSPSQQNGTPISWLSGKITFKKTPLPAVFKELERAFNIKIDDPKNILSEKNLTATYNTTDVEEIIKTISNSFETSYQNPKPAYYIIHQ